MFGHGYLFDLRHTMYFALKISSNCVIVTGMVICLCVTSTTSVKCNPMDISRNECEGYQVRDLNCFGRHKSYNNFQWKCVWTDEEHAPRNVVTLAVLQQRRKPHCTKNISGTSTYISVYRNTNMTVYAFKESDPNCTAIFEGLPQNLVQCDPPYNVTFIRHLRQLNVTVTWREEDRHAIQNYLLRYKTPDSMLWDEPEVRSRDAEKSTVGALNSSLAYNVQIQCVSNSMCSQCPWSEIYTVPPELTLPPTLLKIEDVELEEKKGSRLVSLTWKVKLTQRTTLLCQQKAPTAARTHDLLRLESSAGATSVLVSGYKVAIWKASGEPPCEWMNTSQTKITVILSYSAYSISISAFNNVSTSPAVSTKIPLQKPISSTEKLTVTVNSNVSYTISWKDNLTKTYCCFAVEWYIRGHEMAYKSFFERKRNYKNISLTEPLEPYKRYIVTLHTRPNKDSCNLKHINNSENTYASVAFYITEGSPVSAPTNISSYSVTLHSMVLQWQPILEEDLRGFLLGYVIHYMEYQQRTMGVEKNVTVGPGSNSQVLQDLKSGTVYRVQMSAVTSAGGGVRSAESFFKTNSRGPLATSVVFRLAAIVMICTFALLLLKRVKPFFWPNIPNPGNSSAIEKINESHELVLLKPINMEKLEEWDTDSLHIVKKQHETQIETLPTVLSSHQDTLAERGSTSETACMDPFQIDAGDTSGSDFSDNTGATGAASAVMKQNIPTGPFNFLGDYTTVEMFQQAMPQSFVGTAMASHAAGPQSGEPDVTMTETRMGYVRQFSTSPESNGDEFYT